MERGWAERIMDSAVETYPQHVFGGLQGFCEGPPYPILDWRVALYLVRQIGWYRSGELRAVALAFHARAVALAECFYAAGKYVHEGRACPLQGAAWAAMGRCPGELRQRIVTEANLVLPHLAYMLRVPKCLRVVADSGLLSSAYPVRSDFKASDLRCHLTL